MEGEIWHPQEEIIPPEIVSTPEAIAKARRGRPEAIGDVELRSARNNLVALLENTWGEIGWTLRRVKTVADVRGALQVWEGITALPLPAIALLRPTDQSTTTKKLRDLERRKDELTQFLTGEAEDHRRRCRDSLDKVHRVQSQQLTHEQQELVTEQLARRSAAFQQAEADYFAVQNKIKEVEETINDGYAYFARVEALRFCKSGIYEINPFNTANALAGLPFIGYRQSIKRCRGWRRDDGFPENVVGAGFPYAVFLILKKIFDSRRAGIALESHAEDWLRAKRPESYALTELRRKWYYLRRAITTVVSVKPLPRSIPYRVTTEYFRRIRDASNIDVIFEEDEQIVPR